VKSNCRDQLVGKPALLFLVTQYLSCGKVGEKDVSSRL